MKIGIRIKLPVPIIMMPLVPVDQSGFVILLEHYKKLLLQLRKPIFLDTNCNDK